MRIARDGGANVDIRRGETIKDPFTGKSIDPRHQLKPDFQYIDKKTGDLIRVRDAKSSATAEGAAALARAANAKYQEQVLKLSRITGQPPAPVDTITEVRGRYTSPRVQAGVAVGALMFIEMLVTGGGDWSFLYDQCSMRGGAACLPG
jgi:hypothetical protein